ncbi:hypothetical protein DFH06DRAFT_1123801 [Mycena polygramma]|nr:hypothetical protein DFH06DRAFT_1123801 [Mycena polygramma]
MLPTPTPPFPPQSRTVHALHARLLSWFLDAPAAPFGVHRMALAGRRRGRMWGTLVDAFPACGLGVSVATDGTLYQTKVYAASHSPLLHGRSRRRSLLPRSPSLTAVGPASSVHGRLVINPRLPSSPGHGHAATSSSHAREHRSLSPEAAAYARGAFSSPEGYARAGSMGLDFVCARGGSMSPDFGPCNNSPMTEEELFVLTRRASSTTDHDNSRAPPAGGPMFWCLSVFCWPSTTTPYQDGDLEAVLELERRMAKVYPDDYPLKRFAQRHVPNFIDAIADHDLGFAKTFKIMPLGSPASGLNPPNANSNGNAAPSDSNKRPGSSLDRKLETQYKRLRPDERDLGRGKYSPPPSAPSPSWDRDRDVIPPMPLRQDPPRTNEKTLELPTALHRLITRFPQRETFTFDGPVFKIANLMCYAQPSISSVHVPRRRHRLDMEDPLQIMDGTIESQEACHQEEDNCTVNGRNMSETGITREWEATLVGNIRITVHNATVPQTGSSRHEEQIQQKHQKNCRVHKRQQTFPIGCNPSRTLASSKAAKRLQARKEGVKKGYMCIKYPSSYLYTQLLSIHS